MAILITLPTKYTEIAVFSVDKYREILEGTPGIYYIYDKANTLIYVGQAKDLYARMIQHRSGRSNSRRFYEEIHYFHVFTVDDGYEREIYETHAIHTLRPLYNISKSFKRSISDAERQARERVIDLQEERRELSSENRRIEDQFGDAIYYCESDMEPEELESWGTLEHNKRRISEINEEIKELRKIR